MRHAHFTSGGRYPVLRSVAVLYMVAALIAIGVGIWRAVDVFGGGSDFITSDLFGGSSNAAARIMSGLSWLGMAFIAALVFVGVAEMIKLFIDIEHNSRMIAQRSLDASGRPMAGDNAAREGRAGGQQVMGGEETAEGALLRGH